MTPPKRGSSLSGKAQTSCAFSALGLGAYAVQSHIGTKEVPLLLAFYVLTIIVLLYFMFSGTRWRKFTHLPIAKGRVLVIVPAYNEEPELLKATIEALLNQTRLPDSIHVIDDGSAVPSEEYVHPLVTWHRQDNQGKRHAQANVLKIFKAEDWDYILTVDSDSVLYEDALEQLLRAMSDSKVQAATGMLHVRNHRENLLTKLVDLNVVTSCLISRMARSRQGAVCPTSGALALYRASVIYNNLDDYLTSGTVGDDRRLSLYALLKGQVVAVNEAVVETALPSTIPGMFNQRLRWSKSAWQALPWVITNLPLVPMIYYVYPLMFAFMWPVVLVAMVSILINYSAFSILYALLFWVVVSISQTIMYAAYRPGLTKFERVWAVVISTGLPFLGMLILRPAMYWALVKVRSNSWHTRASAEVS